MGFARRPLLLFDLEIPQCEFGYAGDREFATLPSRDCIGLDVQGVGKLGLRQIELLANASEFVRRHKNHYTLSILPESSNAQAAYHHELLESLWDLEHFETKSEAMEDTRKQTGHLPT